MRSKDGKIQFRSMWAADKDALRQALESASAGLELQRNQSTALVLPVVRGMGMVKEVMERGGPQAVSDLWRAGFPIALAGRIASFFTPLSPDQRGIAAVLTLAAGMLAALSILGTWVFT